MNNYINDIPNRSHNIMQFVDKCFAATKVIKDKIHIEFHISNVNTCNWLLYQRCSACQL